MRDMLLTGAAAGGDELKSRLQVFSNYRNFQNWNGTFSFEKG
jgi:hypothetical protein